MISKQLFKFTKFFPIFSQRLTLINLTARPKIYTRTGDKGTTMLYSGERLSKTTSFFHTLGTLDELNSNVGHMLALCRQHKIPEKQIEQIVDIQNRIFDIGAHVGTPRDSKIDPEILKKTQFSDIHTTKLEKWIDEMTEKLPPLTGFILPAGGIAMTSVHVCRSVCRRCERVMTELLQDKKIDDSAYKYINRLSDYFFTLARYIAKVNNEPEVHWKKSNN